MGQLRPPGVLRGTLSLTGYELPEGLSYEEWANEGEMLLAMGRAGRWWLGDWLTYGEGHYGDRAAHALEATGFTYELLADAARVSRNVQIPERSEILSFGHHREVAALPPSEQRRFLARAEDEGMPVLKLKAAVKKWQKEQERAKTPPASSVPDGCDIHLGDFREVLADLEPESIDLIVTDPPYEDAALPLFGDLAAWAAKVLKPAGVCAVYTGVFRLPEVVAQLERGGLTYRWCYCLDQQAGSQDRFTFINVLQAWKPILIFSRDKWAPPPWGKDVLVSPAPEKGHHAWQQSLAPVRELIERFSAPGWVVADPFLGGGTTAVAALELGRQFLGAEIDAEALALASERIAGCDA